MQSKRIKLVFFVTDFDITGGAQNMLLNLLDGLDRQKFDIVLVSLASLKGSRGIVTRELKRRGERLYELRMRAKWDLGVLLRFWRMLKWESPDILYSLLFHPNMIARIIGKAVCRVPVVINGQRGLDRWRRFYHTLLDRWTARWCDGVIALSEAARQRLIRIEHLAPDKIRVIYNGIDASRYEVSKELARRRIFEFLGKADKGEILIGSVCRLHRKKGLIYALTAIKKILALKQNFLYVIVGEGPEQRRLAAFIAKHKLSERVFLVGEKPKIQEFLSGFDVFLLPSVDEGFGNVFLEAQAAGVPVVATREGGIPEAVEDGVSGILVERKNAIQIAEALSVLLENADLRGKMGVAGRQRVKEKFSIQRMVSENRRYFLELYEESKAFNNQCR